MIRMALLFLLAFNVNSAPKVEKLKMADLDIKYRHFQLHNYNKIRGLSKYFLASKNEKTRVFFAAQPYITKESLSCKNQAKAYLKGNSKGGLIHFKAKQAKTKSGLRYCLVNYVKNKQRIYQRIYFNNKAKEILFVTFVSTEPRRDSFKRQIKNLYVDYKTPKVAAR